MDDNILISDDCESRYFIHRDINIALQLSTDLLENYERLTKHGFDSLSEDTKCLMQIKSECLPFLLRKVILACHEEANSVKQIVELLPGLITQYSKISRHPDYLRTLEELHMALREFVITDSLPPYENMNVSKEIDMYLSGLEEEYDYGIAFGDSFNCSETPDMSQILKTLFNLVKDYDKTQTATRLPTKVLHRLETGTLSFVSIAYSLYHYLNLQRENLHTIVNKLPTIVESYTECCKRNETSKKYQKNMDEIWKFLLAKTEKLKLNLHYKNGAIKRKPCKCAKSPESPCCEQEMVEFARPHPVRSVASKERSQQSEEESSGFNLKQASSGMALNLPNNYPLPENAGFELKEDSVIDDSIDRIISVETDYNEVYSEFCPNDYHVGADSSTAMEPTSIDSNPSTLSFHPSAEIPKSLSIVRTTKSLAKVKQESEAVPEMKGEVVAKQDDIQNKSNQGVQSNSKDSLNTACIEVSSAATKARRDHFSHSKDDERTIVDMKMYTFESECVTSNKYQTETRISTRIPETEIPISIPEMVKPTPIPEKVIPIPETVMPTPIPEIVMPTQSVKPEIKEADLNVKIEKSEVKAASKSREGSSADFREAPLRLGIDLTESQTNQSNEIIESVQTEERDLIASKKESCPIFSLSCSQLLILCLVMVLLYGFFQQYGWTSFSSALKKDQQHIDWIVNKHSGETYGNVIGWICSQIESLDGGKWRLCQ